MRHENGHLRSKATEVALEKAEKRDTMSVIQRLEYVGKGFLVSLSSYMIYNYE